MNLILSQFIICYFFPEFVPNIQCTFFSINSSFNVMGALEKLPRTHQIDTEVEAGVAFLIGARAQRGARLRYDALNRF